MSLFFSKETGFEGSLITLDEDNSRHIISVLRMAVGEKLTLTNGEGILMKASIADDHKKRCQVRIDSVENHLPVSPKITIAVSLLKNSSRLEWFLEKATEIGVHSIIPLIAERTEKQQFRIDRMRGILVSAMLQSQQYWLPGLQEPVKMNRFLETDFGDTRKLIAHCDDQHKTPLTSLTNDRKDTVICIGPEGDFTREEITKALSQHFVPVGLGATRLRTETAAVVAATLLCIR